MYLLRLLIAACTKRHFEMCHISKAGVFNKTLGKLATSILQTLQLLCHVGTLCHFFGGGGHLHAAGSPL